MPFNNEEPYDTEIPEENVYFEGPCTCDHQIAEHGWGWCDVEGCDCKAGWCE